MKISQHISGGRSYIALIDDLERVVEMPSRWLQSMLDNRLGRSPKTIELYGRNLGYFLDFLRLNELWRNLTLDEILKVAASNVPLDYLSSLAAEGLAQQTIHNRDITLKEFFTWLTTHDAGKFRTDNPYSDGKPKSKPGYAKHVRFVHPDQVVTILQAIHSESWRCIIHFMYDSGARCSEIPRVTKGDVDRMDLWPEHVSYLPIELSGSKGRSRRHKPRTSLLSRAVVSRIKRYHSSPDYRLAIRQYKNPNEAPAFVNLHGKPLTTRSIASQLSSAADRANLPPKDYSPHNFRHGAAISILRSELGGDYMDKLVLVQKQLGHNSIRSTETYTNIPPQLYAAINESGVIRTRFEEAQTIYDSTFLPRKRHKETRGRR
jgi:integrase/recombinase XerC